ncbi:unnamed protein product, partial [Ixodes pacificus]
MLRRIRASHAWQNLLLGRQPGSHRVGPGQVNIAIFGSPLLRAHAVHEQARVARPLPPSANCAAARTRRACVTGAGPRGKASAHTKNTSGWGRRATPALVRSRAWRSRRSTRSAQQERRRSGGEPPRR